MIGIHNAKKSKIVNKTFKTIEESIEYETKLLNLTCSQIFTHGPRSRSKNKINYKNIKKYCMSNNIKLYVHGSYLTIGLWSIIEKKNKLDINVNHIIDSLLSCIKLNSRGLVIHLPKKEPSVVRDCLKILESKILEHKFANILLKCRILLEMPAMKSDNKKTYESPEKLNKLCNILDSGLSKLKWGYCIDTSHLWSAGIDLSKNNSWLLWQNNLLPETLKKIKLIHLNGSLEKYFNKGKDTHIIPFSPNDAIWNNYISNELLIYINKCKSGEELKHSDISQDELELLKSSSLYNILQLSKKNKIPIICEINRGTTHDVELYIKLINILLNH